MGRSPFCVAGHWMLAVLISAGVKCRRALTFTTGLDLSEVRG